MEGSQQVNSIILRGNSPEAVPGKSVCFPLGIRGIKTAKYYASYDENF
jgi:hypothetical protein